MLSGIVLRLILITVGATVHGDPSDFVRDEAKPYVYIGFDHAGKRTPLSDDDGLDGLWLRLVNNCNLPISIHTFDPAAHDSGIGVSDEIVASSVSYTPLAANAARQLSEKPPRGYSLEIYSTTIIPPGHDVLFSIPRNHVSPDWHLRVQFELEPTKKGLGLQPYSFVDFTWTMIPEKDRVAGHR